MEQQLHSLEQLIGALINISRMETGMIRLQPEEGRIFDTILEAVNRIWLKAQQKDIEIQMEAADEIEDLRIMQDRKWLCEALINLLDNAVKYSPSGTMITLRAFRMTSFLRIEIQDQGIGIPRENYHKVFQRFYRGKQPEVQREEGAGVGLVQKIQEYGKIPGAGRHEKTDEKAGFPGRNDADGGWRSGGAGCGDGGVRYFSELFGWRRAKYSAAGRPCW